MIIATVSIFNTVVRIQYMYKINSTLNDLIQPIICEEINSIQLNTKNNNIKAKNVLYQSYFLYFFKCLQTYGTT